MVKVARSSLEVDDRLLVVANVLWKPKRERERDLTEASIVTD